MNEKISLSELIPISIFDWQVPRPHGTHNAHSPYNFNGQYTNAGQPLDRDLLPTSSRQRSYE